MPPRAKNAPEPPSDAPNSDKPEPTAAEAFLFFTLIKNMRGRPDIDWEQVAVDNGFKNAETAKVRFGQIKRKLGLNDTNAQSSAATPRAPRAGGRGKKVATVPSPITAGPGDDSEFVSDVLGPSPSGVKKEKARPKRNARPKTEDFASGESFATPTKTKKAPKKTAVKNEEDSDMDDQTTLPPVHVVDEEGDGPMDVDEETNLGRITPSVARTLKPDPGHAAGIASGTMPAQNAPVHPMYIDSTLAPIPGTDCPWHNDDEGAIGQLRQEVHNTGKDKQANAGFHQEVDLSSMMAGGLPGGGSSGLYSAASQGAHFQGHWDVSVPNSHSDYGNYGSSSIFGNGSGARKDGELDDYDDVGRL